VKKEESLSMFTCVEFEYIHDEFLMEFLQRGESGEREVKKEHREEKVLTIIIHFRKSL
jgi:hypothetical protein